MKLFLYDPMIAELAAELRESVSTGRMPYRDALETLKKALREALQSRAVVIRDSSTN